ncbi:MAG TPA: type II secretion system protein GspE, partial [Actinomycetes bacterium]|nr:type II secretion system protein GspE [Actinomycetes bacterium]
LECGHSGYRGRTGVFEVLELSPAIRRAFTANPVESSLTDQALAVGATTLRDAGLAAAAEGRTTYEEALRVTHADAYREV